MSNRFRKVISIGLCVALFITMGGCGDLNRRGLNSKMPLPETLISQVEEPIIRELAKLSYVVVETTKSLAPPATQTGRSFEAEVTQSLIEVLLWNANVLGDCSTPERLSENLHEAIHDVEDLEEFYGEEGIYMGDKPIYYDSVPLVYSIWVGQGVEGTLKVIDALGLSKPEDKDHMVFINLLDDEEYADQVGTVSRMKTEPSDKMVYITFGGIMYSSRSTEKKAWRS